MCVPHPAPWVDFQMFLRSALGVILAVAGAGNIVLVDDLVECLENVESFQSDGALLAERVEVLGALRKSESHILVL